MTRTFYAVHRDKDCPTQVRRFSTLAKAVRWTSEAPEHRELAPRAAPLVRRATRYARQGMPWPQMVME